MRRGAARGRRTARPERPAVARCIIAPDSAAATGDWGTIVDRMVRGDELRVRLTRTDTLIAGRSVEQLTQYYQGVRVWGGSVAGSSTAAAWCRCSAPSTRGSTSTSRRRSTAMPRGARARSASAARCCSPTPIPSSSSCRRTTDVPAGVDRRGHAARATSSASSSTPPSGRVVRRYSVRAAPGRERRDRPRHRRARRRQEGQRHRRVGHLPRLGSAAAAGRSSPTT